MKEKQRKKFRILAVSDEPTLKKYEISCVKRELKDIDFIISAGDVSNYYLDYLVSIFDKRLIYVNGNHTYATHHDISFCDNIDGKTIRIKGLKILGFDGSRGFFKQKHEYTEAQMIFKFVLNLINLLIRKPDIVVSHAPPRGIHDIEKDPIHRGFNIYNSIIKMFKPKLWLHGHIHLQSHFTKQETLVENTRVINVFGYKVIEFEI